MQTEIHFAQPITLQTLDMQSTISK